MVASLIVGYLLASWLLRLAFGGNEPDGGILVVCGITLPLGLLLTFLAERGLKTIWRSGRTIEVDGQRVRLVRPGEAAPVINVGAPFTAIKWYFQLGGYPRGGRERHISPKWFCLGYQLQQDDRRMVFFSFMSPRQAKQVVAAHAFRRIQPTDIYDSSFVKRTFGLPERPSIPARIISGADGREWLAERNRWQEGVELTRHDFRKLLAIIEPDATAGSA